MTAVATFCLPTSHQQSLYRDSRATIFCGSSGWPSPSPLLWPIWRQVSFSQETMGLVQRACEMYKYQREHRRAEVPPASQRRNFLTDVTRSPHPGTHTYTCDEKGIHLLDVIIDDKPDSGIYQMIEQVITLKNTNNPLSTVVRGTFRVLSYSSASIQGCFSWGLFFALDPCLPVMKNPKIVASRSSLIFFFSDLCRYIYFSPKD